MDHLDVCTSCHIIQCTSQDSVPTHARCVGFFAPKPIILSVNKTFSEKCFSSLITKLRMTSLFCSQLMYSNYICESLMIACVCVNCCTIWILEGQRYKSIFRIRRKIYNYQLQLDRMSSCSCILMNTDLAPVGCCSLNGPRLVFRLCKLLIQNCCLKCCIKRLIKDSDISVMTLAISLNNCRDTLHVCEQLTSSLQSNISKFLPSK